MNNNNLYNTNNFIGITHNDYFKTASNALSKAINSLELNSSNYTSNVSNILDIKITNVNTNSSNYIQNTSNYIITRYDPMIETKSEDITLPIPATLKHTYINNSNTLGEIRFWCKSTSSFYIPEDLIGIAPEHRTKIDVDGKLKIYYIYNPAINATFFSGWIDIATSIVALNASDANIGISLGGLEAQLLALNNRIYNLATDTAKSIANNCLLEDESAIELLDLLRNGNSLTPTGYIGTFENVANNVFLGFRYGNISYLNAASTNILYIIGTNPISSFFLGLGGVAFAAAVSAAQDMSFVKEYSHELVKFIDSNVGISQAQKDELYSSNNNKRILKYVSYCSNMSNMTIAQGFINTYNSNQQYISSLKCDTLDLNTGNITNINGIAANELIANGKIKQNGILLDNIYLTSNHLYNLAYTYTAERQYPSKLYTTTTQQDTVSLLGKLVYHQTLYLDNQTIAYGSGIYELYSSSSYDTPTTKDRLFNFNTTETTTSPRWAISLYNSGTGNYQGDNSIDNVYFGDWIILKLPQPILLTRYRIYQRSDFLTKAPAEWKVYGSNDGITFIEITEASQTTRLTSYTSGYYEKSLNPSFITLYQYIGYTFKSLLSTSGQTDLSFSELQIFGKEIISNSITSQIYTTSNVVKGIVQYEMPIIGKHYGFYITISTPIVINGTTFYKYDINLTPYCNKGVIQIGPQSGDTFRSFKIRVMYATMYFSYIINDLPNVCYYEVFMSYKNAASPPNGVAGLNACSIGFPPNPTLQAVMPNNLFVIKNGAGSIDYITVVSSSQADCRVIIEDLIG
jgi:hypothetical protein